MAELYYDRLMRQSAATVEALVPEGLTADEAMAYADEHIPFVDEDALASRHDPNCACGQCQENDRLGYDADVSDSRQYCRHGTFVGSWWGPDYLCPACEMGE